MIHIYTGNGKGKTTAAIGLAMRALGANKKIYFVQFVKKGCYCEIKSLNRNKKIKIEQFGRSCFIKNKSSSRDIELAQQGIEKIEAVLKKRIFDMVILDEINVAIKLNLINPQDVANLLKSAGKTEIILTGRGAPKKLIALADYVTEMKEIKHPYQKKIKARKGIEF